MSLLGQTRPRQRPPQRAYALLESPEQVILLSADELNRAEARTVADVRIGRSGAIKIALCTYIVPFGKSVVQIVPLITRCSLQRGTSNDKDTFPHILEHLSLGFGQPTSIVHEIDQQNTCSASLERMGA